MTKESFFDLSGQTAVVTGGGQGIGESIVKRLHAAGARVAGLDVNEKNAQRGADAVDGIAIQCDVSSKDSVLSAVAAVQSTLGDITILVNNAGITGKTDFTWALDPREFDTVYAVNLRGVYLMCHAVISKMLDKGYGR